MENSSRYYSACIQHTNLGIIILNLDGTIVETNPCAELIYHLSKNDLFEKNFASFFVKKDQPIIQEGLKNCLEKEFILDEATLQRKGERSILIEMSAKTITIDDKKFILVSMKDITSRKQLTRQHILQDRLKAISTLAAGISHEINNPAAYIYTNLYFVLDELNKLKSAITDLDTLEKITLIEAALSQSLNGVERIHKIINSLKGFTYINDQENKMLNLNEIIEASIGVIGYEISERATLEKKYEVENPQLAGNPGKLQQMFTHILLNALQSIPPGHPGKNKIEIKTQQRMDGILINITDTGKGIAVGSLPEIFDLFYTTKPTGAGYGLGLSICYDIVRAHQGDINVTSTPEEGTQVSIFLPYRELEPITDSRPSPPQRVEKKLRILIVDDEVYLLDSLKRILESEFEITTCSSALKAYESIRKNPRQFDVILTDLIMPEMSGMDLYTKIASQYPELKPSFIFMTGGIFNEKVQHFLQDVSNRCIDKPFRMDELRDLLFSN